MNLRQKSEPVTGHGVRLDLLLAEDSRVTQGIIKRVLTQRGHAVDIAEDGVRASEMLRIHRYQVALIDFHLPEMDGVRVVAELKTYSGSLAKLPYFIGLTADIRGLLAHPDNCETFDLVVAKPIDIVHLCNVIENFESYMAWTRRNESERGELSPTPVLLADPAGFNNADERRIAARKKIDRGGTVMSLRNGEVHSCRVIDLSLTGAALEVAVRPAIGERVHVGRTSGRIVRHTNEGVSVEFTRETPSIHSRTA